MNLTGIDPSQLEKLASRLGISVDRLTSISIDELANLLKQRTAKPNRELDDSELAAIAGGAGILDDLDPMLLELLRSRPQF